ncbi:MAG: ATP-binding protein [Candidatus Omnitrophota bacterium]
MKFAPKLTVVFISIGIIVAAIMFTIVYFQVADILENEVRARIEDRVFFVMNAIDSFLYEKLNDVKVICHDPVISSESASAEQITERLIYFRNVYKCFVSFSFLNLEHIRIADTTGLHIGEQYQMERYLKDVLSGEVITASDVSLSKDFKVPMIYLVSLVNNKQGKAIGIIVARIPLTLLFEIIKGGGKIQEGERIDLVNKDSILLYSNYNYKGILKDNLSEWESIKRAHHGEIKGSAKHQHPGEEKMLYVFSSEQGYLDFKGNGWTIIYHVPTRDIFKLDNKLLRILIMIFLSMLPGLALVIYLFSKTVTRPLIRISAAAEEIGKGKLDTVIEVKTKDEFGFLANSFNNMAQDLKIHTTSIDNLNKEIVERNKIEGEREKILSWHQDVNMLQQLLLVSAPLENKLKCVTDGIVRIFGADFCRIWLIRPGDLCEQGCFHAQTREGPHVCRFRDKCLHLIASSGRYTHLDGKVHSRVPFGGYKIGRIASEKDHKFLTNDVLNDPRVYNHEWARELGLVSFAGYQLRVPAGEAIGVLGLFAKHPILPAEDAILDSLSTTAAFVVQQAIAEDSIRRQSQKLDASLKDSLKSREILTSMLEDNNKIREKIIQSEAMFRDIFDEAGDGILIADLESKKFYLGNKAICRMLGYGREEIINLEIRDIHSEKDLSYVIKQFGKQVQSKAGTRVLFNNLPVKKKDGSVFYADVSSTVIDIFGKPYVMGIFHDLSERKEIVDLKRVNQLKKNFISNMSHELRTPLNAIIGFSEVLYDQKFGVLNETQKDYLNDVLESSKFLLSLINDILDLAKIESGKMKLVVSNFSLKDLLGHSLILVKEKALKHNIELSSEIAEEVGYIRADERKVRQIIFNLLSNAVKFTPDGGKAGINAKIKGLEAEVTVWDTGVGISKEDQNKLFKPFMQLEIPLDKQYQGTGLGLSLTKEFVELHKGKIWVESEGRGKGSSFKFSLPIDSVKVTQHEK